jgi:type II secretory pathway pseudopilin PulG
MKVLSHSVDARAFTIVEIMVSLAVFSFVIAAMVSSQLFGLRVNAATSAKLTSTAGARFTMDQVRDRIRSANTIYVGNWNGAVFLAATNGQRQEGRALQIFSSTNAALYYLYYLSTTTNQLVIYHGDGTNGASRILTGNITNQVIFDAEDFQGNVLTNNQNNRIISMTLDFYQFEYASGSRGNAYNHYQLRMRAAQRLLN